MNPPLPPVVFEDDAIVAFNKPSGLLVAPDRWDKSLSNLMGMVHEQRDPGWFNAHRLDKDTSGLVLCAKTKPALDHLCRQFEQHRVRKEYLALARGVPKDDRGLISAPIVDDPQRPGRMMTAKRGKPAETAYEAVERFRGLTLFSLAPRTGRTHQLRVHLVSIGCPIVGDPFYGDGRGFCLSEIKKGYKHKGRGQAERPLISRLALHACRLAIEHPSTGLPLVIEAPLPKDMEIALKYLRKFG